MVRVYEAIKRIVLRLLIMIALFVGWILLFHITVNVKYEKQEFVESALELKNPNRGLYRIYRFLISDESKDYDQDIVEIYEKDAETTLSLVEINLQNYCEGQISERGLTNIEDLFHALEKTDKRLIVRFLYDWNGENEKYEPESLETILLHMKQIEPILDEFSDCIFIIQGLFTGHWGEMHGTRFSSVEDMKRLAAQLNKVVDDSVYLSVRTPLQWRNITGMQDISIDSLTSDSLAKRLGLFNDGMLGSESDYGTYKIHNTEAGEFGRKEELLFQEELCRIVPNGGEVICDNPYNDFENAVKDLEIMHVTYLNDGYDKNVLEKWKKEVFTEEGCFKGMDGLTYIKRRLGYRLLITAVDYDYELFDTHMIVNITMKNAGFAPVYREPQIQLFLYNRKKGELRSYEIQEELGELVGGREADRLLNIRADIDLSKLMKGKYEIYFLLVDPDTGRHILLANEQEEKQYGYFLGSVELQNGIQYMIDCFSRYET